MKKIIILYSEDDWEKLSLPETSRIAFEQVYRLGEEMGVTFLRSSIHWYDLRQGNFSKAWSFQDNLWVRVEGPIKPDGILDRTESGYEDGLFAAKMDLCARCPMVNHPLFGQLLGNKLYQSVLFREYMPQSTFVANQHELDQVGKLTGDTVVIKPLFGSGGNGIWIGDKRVLPENLRFPIVAQEFLQSYYGIPGFSQENSPTDLRLIYIGNTLSYALSRTAKEGSRLTNFHQGATVVRVPDEAIPQDALKLGKSICDRLSLFPMKMLSVDIMYDRQEKPHLIEVNTKPGFDLLYLMRDDTLVRRFTSDLLNLISS